MVDDNKMMQLKYYKNIKKYYKALNTNPKSTVKNQKHRYPLEQQILANTPLEFVEAEIF